MQRCCSLEEGRQLCDYWQELHCSVLVSMCSRQCGPLLSNVSQTQNQLLHRSRRLFVLVLQEQHINVWAAADNNRVLSSNLLVCSCSRPVPCMKTGCS